MEGFFRQDLNLTWSCSATWKANSHRFAFSKALLLAAKDTTVASWKGRMLDRRVHDETCFKPWVHVIKMKTISIWTFQSSKNKPVPFWLGSTACLNTGNMKFKDSSVFYRGWRPWKKRKKTTNNSCNKRLQLGYWMTFVHHSRLRKVVV